MKTTIVSSEQLKRYKKQLIIISLFFLAALNITVGMIIFDGESFLLFNIPLIVILPYILYREFKNLSTIAYDEHTLYYGSTSSRNFTKFPSATYDLLVLER